MSRSTNKTQEHAGRPRAEAGGRRGETIRGQHVPYRFLCTKITRLE